MPKPTTLNIIGQPLVNSLILGWNNALFRIESLYSCTLQIKRAGTPWVRAFVNREIRSVYGRRQFQINNLPISTTLIARLRLTTSLGVAFSNEIVFTTVLPPGRPRDVVAYRPTVGATYDINLDWVCDNDGGSPLSKFYIDYSVNGGSSWYGETVTVESVSVGNNKFSKGFNFSVDNSNNSFIFRVRAQNNAGLISVVSENSRPVYLPPEPGSSVLFDKTDWGDVIPSPWRERLTFAAEEWEKFIKMDPEIIEAIRAQVNSNFNGILLNVRLYEDINDPATASCGLNDYAWSQDYFTNQFYPFSIIVNINIAYNRTDDEWKETLVHELGHGLGIGPGWTQVPIQTGKSPDFTAVSAPAYALSTRSRSRGNNVMVYPEMERSYRTFHNSSTLVRIPLIWQESYQTTGGQTIPIDELNRLSHFSYEINPFNDVTRAWKTIPEDIMSYGHIIGVRRRITALSVGALLDFGYVLANTVIEANQTVVLSYDNVTKYLYANSTPVTYNKQNVTYQTWDSSPSTIPLFEAVAADVVGSPGVNQLVWKHRDGSLHTWNLNTNWEFISSESTTASPSTTQFYSKETTFQTDINKDGVIGTPPQVLMTSATNTAPTVFSALSDNPDAFRENPPPEGTPIGTIKKDKNGKLIVSLITNGCAPSNNSCNLGETTVTIEYSTESPTET